jgi:hypothetical protein
VEEISQKGKVENEREREETYSSTIQGHLEHPLIGLLKSMILASYSHGLGESDFSGDKDHRRQARRAPGPDSAKISATWFGFLKPAGSSLHMGLDHSALDGGLKHMLFCPLSSKETSGSLLKGRLSGVWLLILV